MLARPASLDPRLGGGLASEMIRPIADAGPDREVPLNTSFELDAGNSRAAPGSQIETYIWTLRNSDT